MTRLRKPVRRRVQLSRGDVMVTLYPDNRISFRYPWQRDEFVLSLDTVLLRAADAHQQRERDERKKARAIRRAG